MNVMLASVAQRTSEIGLRLAIGASERAVQAQFLGEAVLLSLVGGLLGVALSTGGTVILGQLLEWPLEIPPEAIVLALFFAAGVGIFFGYYPARRAARLDPISALKHE
jgi:putative ABC transport system permease protein